MSDIPEGQEPEGNEDEPRNFDESYVKELRAEAAGYRVERNELKKQVEALAKAQKDREDSKKSELERAQAKVADLEKTIADKDAAMAKASLRAMVLSEAAKLNVVDTDAVYRLLDLDSIDEDPASLKKALTALLKEKPYLVKEDAPPSPGVPGPPVKGGKPSTDQMMADMLKAGAKK